jgi:hypothetical protein
MTFCASPFVFLAGNHDHHFVVDQAAELLRLELITGKPPGELQAEALRREANQPAT